MDEAEIMKGFWGKEGEPVPEVDPSDMKALWKLGEDISKKNPGRGVAVGVNLMEAHCKPGANIGAITYRAQMIGRLRRAAPDVMDPLVRDKLDAVLSVASDIPMKWIGATVHEGWTFDPDDFLRRVREA
jgi:hypothetical protein